MKIPTPSPQARGGCKKRGAVPSTQTGVGAADPGGTPHEHKCPGGILGKYGARRGTGSKGKPKYRVWEIQGTKGYGR